MQEDFKLSDFGFEKITDFVCSCGCRYAIKKEKNKLVCVNCKRKYRML